MLRILFYITIGYSFTFAIDNVVVFYEPAERSIVAVFRGKDLRFQEKNNECIAFLEGTIQVFDENRIKVYEKKFYEELLLDEQNNIPDDQELFLRKYSVPHLPTSALIYVFFNDREKPFVKSLRPSYKKSFVLWNFLPENFTTAFFLSELPIMSLKDTLKLQSKKQRENQILLVSLLFSENNKFVEIASYSWYLKKRKNFIVPLQLFSEGKYSLLVFSENKKNILLKKDFFIFSPQKFRALQTPQFVARIRKYHYKIFGKPLPEAPSKKYAEEFFMNLLKYNFQDSSLKQFVSAFAGSLSPVKKHKNLELYSQEPNNFYYIIKQTPENENIRIP